MTRHQLSLLVLSLVALSGCAGTDSGRDGGTREPERILADSLVGSWLEAAGGMDAWRDVEAARFTITTVWYDSTGEISRMRPRRVEFRNAGGVHQSRIERPEAEGLYVQVFTGSDEWATLNDRPLPADHDATDESEYVGRDVVYWFGLPYKLFDPGVQRRGRVLPDGGYEVRVTFGDGVGLQPGDRYFYYFLDEDPFPEEVHYISEGRGEESRNRTVWRGYASLGDFSYVVTRRWLDSLDRPTKELRVDDVQLNPILADSLFRPPADPRAGSGDQG